MTENRNASQIVSIISTILVIGLAIYLGTLVKSVDTIEEKLSHQAQQIERVTIASNGSDATSAYVPAYSHIYTDGGKAVLLETTLVVRNTDPKNSINIHSIDYFDTNGNLVRQFLEEGYELSPLSSSEYLVEKRETSGGVGANFIVNWSNPNQASKPIFEAVMIGAGQGKDISFTSRAPQ
ncbi:MULTISPECIES: DUF3124 domain-containing protein [Vibrio]|uniref:DUF3124 domain-containing protein n=2 Tax=Vibrio TaxID=662 RepID=A0A090S060_9VIBR|nr:MULTISPECIES: DUF3124 domain-containing protein [Vibrio]USD61790.1 DUF3124 domain-containing protein [Vibrio sp. SCSIO 43140]GAL21100.1 hypothetical protein JCM19235_375 [Vibrio maritimus]GAL29161.1 hypothetical protein JCM19239_2752 [Vibrio variabilis]